MSAPKQPGGQEIRTWKLRGFPVKLEVPRGALGQFLENGEMMQMTCKSKFFKES